MLIDEGLRHGALLAWQCSQDGVRPPTIAEMFDCTVEEARTMIETGRMIETIEQAFLSSRERELIVCLGDLQLERMHAGDLSMPRGWEVSGRLGRSAGWAATASRRLRQGDRGDTLNLIHYAANGYVWMLPAGWAMYALLRNAQESPAGEPTGQT